jgi:hypothetical protein
MHDWRDLVWRLVEEKANQTKGAWDFEIEMPELVPSLTLVALSLRARSEKLDSQHHIQIAHRGIPNISRRCGDADSIV